MASIGEPLLLTATAANSVSIQIVGVPTAQGAIVNYITNTSNNPKLFGNHIYVWQTTSNIVPWNKPPDGDTPINSDSSTSTQPVAFDFENKGYIIGYAVAPNPNAVCATIYMPAGQQENPLAWEYSNLSLSTVFVGTNLVQVKYQGLNSYTPATNKNWIGLWEAGAVPYAGNPQKAVNIPSNAQTGFPVIDGVKLLINTVYSVGYFMIEQSTGRTSLAAQTTFTVGTSAALTEAQSH